MSAEAEHDRAPLATGDEWQSSDVDDSLEGALMRGIPADARLDSGVPEGQRANALDFIQMSGLTRPPARATEAPDPDLNPSAPLSFYEAGVADVDEEASLAALSSGPRDLTLDANLAPDPAGETLGAESEHAAAAFQAIIDALEAGRAPAHVLEDPPAPAPEAVELPEGLDAHGVDPGPLPESANPIRDHRPVAWRSAPSAGDPEEGGVAVPDPDPGGAGVEFGVPEAIPGDDGDFDNFLEDGVIHSAVDAAPQPELAARAELDCDPEGIAPETAPPVSSPHRAALQKAEQLMNSLGQPPAAGMPALPEIHFAEEPAAAPPRALELNGSGGEESYSQAHARRRSRRHSRLARRMWRTARLIASVATAVAIAAGIWFYVLAPRLVRTEDRAAQAARFMASRQYADAAAAYEQVASRGGPSRADALFHAANATLLSVGNDTPTDAARPRYERALAFFATFAEEFPQHPKRPRALALTGRVHFEAQNYDAAIAVLRDQVVPADDPAAALMVLRYLARAYRMKGAYDEAETAYLQAATLPDNFSAEVDYRELGDMHRTRAGLAETDADARRAHEETASRYWNRALQTPGIAPAAAAELHERLQWQSFTGDPPATAASEPVAVARPVAQTPADDSAEIGAAAPGAPAPPYDSPIERLEDPGAELEAWTRGAAAGAPHE